MRSKICNVLKVVKSLHSLPFQALTNQIGLPSHTRVLHYLFINVLLYKNICTY